MNNLSTCIGLFLLALCQTSLAEQPFEVQALLKKHCAECHGADEQNANIRLDQIATFSDGDQHLWAAIHEALTSGKMPPEEQTQPTQAEREQLVSWIEGQAAQAVSEEGYQRRLNRREFSAALQDLTGLPIDFGTGLPADGKVGGFDTGMLGLQDTADSVAQMLEVTRRAVDSIRLLEPDRDRKISIDFREHEFTDFRKFLAQQWNEEDGIFTRSKSMVCRKEVGVYLPTQWAGDRGNSFLAVPAPANKRAALKLTLRVRGKRPMPGLPHPMLWVKVGGNYIDYRSIGDEPQTLTYAIRMEDYVVEGNVIKIMLSSIVEVPYAVDGFENDDRSKPEDNIPGGIGVYRPKYDRKVLRQPEEQPVPAIVVESVVVDYDHCAQWPPAAWDIDIGQLADNDDCAKRLLSLWIDRAWRRPVAEAESARFFALYRQLREQGLSFDNALRSTFQSVLMAGQFRYLPSPADPDPAVAQFALASRLSFMLLGTPPDDELRRLAAEGKLSNEKTLDAQVDRLLNDRRSDEFFQSFVTQWLDMDQPITLSMSHFKKQDFKFGRHLKASLKEETVQYVARLVADNRPARELVSSDWTMMNDILAVHYDHRPLEGGELRKVAWKPQGDDPRGGGILSHAGIQSMLCWMGDNWVIYRGSWALNHILDDPPPPPPLEVPELNPFDQGNRGKSFRELLKQHQEDKNCSICHRTMDPLGFAFQNFDLSGRWRHVEHERYHRAELDGKIEWRGEGDERPVDAAGSLPRGEEFTSFAECKQLLAEHYLDDIVRGFLKKLTLYGTGRTPTVLDLIAIRSIMQEQASGEYSMRDLLKAFVRSKVFLDTALPSPTGAQ